MRRRPTVLARAVVVALAVVSCSGACATGSGTDRPAGGKVDETQASPATGSTSPGTPASRVRPPPAKGAFDYQLDQPYPPGDDVSVVRDREAPSPPGAYGVCYVNAFQTQPQDRAAWLGDRAALVLRDQGGSPVEDPDWPGEMLLDIGSDGRREAAATVMATQLVTCVRNGFAAVELDNLDSWTRSGGRLTPGDAAAYAALLVDSAHERGLAVAQKNAAELLGARGMPAFDFAVTEDCGAYDECSAFTKAYGADVFDVEYTDAGFAAACATVPAVRVVRRDLELAAPGAAGHVLRRCRAHP